MPLRLGPLGGRLDARNHGFDARSTRAARTGNQSIGVAAARRASPVWRSLGLCALALLLAAPVAARAEHDPDELATLVEQGRFEAAYALGRAQFAEHAGETRFDFHYALAAIETGHLNEGIFALERVLIRSPGLDRARLELARALFLQGDDRRARQEFQIVLAHEPPPTVVNRVELYLAAMDRRADRYRTKWTGWLEAELGHDSNVNRAPDSGLIPLEFGTLVLDPDQQEVEADFIASAGAVQLSRPLRPGLNLLAGIDFEARSANNESQFDTRFARGQFGLRRITGRHTLVGLLEAYRYYVGGDGYQGAGGFNGSYSYALGDDTTLFVSGEFLQIEYDELTVQDSRLGYLEFGASRSWTAKFDPRGQIALLVGKEEADDNSDQARALASRDIVGFSAWVGLTPASDWSLQASLRFQHNEYETDVFPFTEAREEDYYGLDIALDWYPDAHWRIGPHLEHSSNDANLEVYDYERTAIGVRARYSFF